MLSRSHHKLQDEKVDRYGSASNEDVIHPAEASIPAVDAAATVPPSPPAVAAQPESPKRKNSRNSNSPSPPPSRQITAVTAADPGSPTSAHNSISDIIDPIDAVEGRNSLTPEAVDPFTELDKELEGIGLSPKGATINQILAAGNHITNTSSSMASNIPPESPSAASAVEALQHTVLNRYYRKDLLQDKYRKSTTDLEWDEMNPSRPADGPRVQLRTDQDEAFDSPAETAEAKNDLKPAKSGLCCVIL